jgi:hypothetical protein
LETLFDGSVVMKDIAAVNGQVTAEVSARYGLHCARINNLSLFLLHVTNPEDSIETVEECIARIEAALTMAAFLSFLLLHGWQ